MKRRNSIINSTPPGWAALSMSFRESDPFRAGASHLLKQSAKGEAVPPLFLPTLSCSQGGVRKEKLLPPASLHPGRTGSSTCAEQTDDILREGACASLSQSSAPPLLMLFMVLAFLFHFSFSLAVSLALCRSPNQPTKFKDPTSFDNFCVVKARSQSMVCVLFYNERWEIATSESHLQVLSIMNLSLFTPTKDQARDQNFSIFPPGSVPLRLLKYTFTLKSSGEHLNPNAEAPPH